MSDEDRARTSGTMDRPLVSPQDRSTLRILVVDDDPTTRQSCESVLAAEGYPVVTKSHGETAERRLKSGQFDIALLDQKEPGTDGTRLLSEVRSHARATLVVVMSGHATAGASVRALQAGAWDYLPKPFTATQLLVLIDRAAGTLVRMRALAGEPGTAEEGVLMDNGVRILGVSRAMRQVVKRALKVAGTDAPVFITGESGTGKELIARCIHRESRRAGKAFVAINCAALPEDLLESEMFGHRRGAFTGAVRDKPGLLETADRGSFFLDELCEMPITLQPKLLRALQDGVLRRVGSEKDDAVVDVRFISATNRDLERALEEGILRHDLYYRLRVVPITIPPLRDRPEDIPVLARNFIGRFWDRHRDGREPAPELAPEALELLQDHTWPGNVRELQNLLEQVVVLAEVEKVIPAEALSMIGEMSGEHPAPPGTGDSFLDNSDLHRPYHSVKQDLIDRFEREYLLAAVRRAGGNMSEAAREAGIDRTTLYRLMDKHDLTKESVIS